MHVFLLTAVLFSAAPAEELPLLSLVPEDARLVLHVPDLGALRSRFAGTALGRFLADETVRGGLPAFREWILGKRWEAAPEEEKLFLSLLEEVEGELAAFVRPREGGGDFAVLAARAGGKVRAFREVLERVKEKLPRLEKFRLSTDVFGDARIFVLEPAGEGTGGNVLFMAEDGRTVLFAADRDREAGMEAVRKIFDTLYAGEAEEKTILDAPRFRRGRERTGGPGQGEFFVDLAAELGRGIPEGSVLSLMGLGALEYFYARIDLEKEEPAVFFLGLAGGGLVADLAAALTSRGANDLDRYIPAGALRFGLGWIDLASMYEASLDFLARGFGEEFARYRTFYEEKVKKRLRIDPEKELLENLDGRTAVFTVEVPEEEMARFPERLRSEIASDLLFPGTAYLAGLKDGDAFRAGLEKTLRALGLYVGLHREKTASGTIFSVAVPGSGIAFYWAFHGDVFACSFFPGAIRAFLRTAAGGRGAAGPLSSLPEGYRDASCVLVARGGGTAKLVLGLFLGLGKRLGGALGEGEAGGTGWATAAERCFAGRTVGFVLDVKDEGIYLSLVTP